jgi:hypothetical protein
MEIGPCDLRGYQPVSLAPQRKGAPMFVVREVLQCKPGKVGELRKKFEALNVTVKRLGFPPFTIMTDVSGENFWTLVLESEMSSVDAFFAMEEKVMSEKDAQQTMVGYHDLVTNGRREIFKKAS